MLDKDDLQAIAGLITESLKPIHNRLDSVDSRLDSMDGRLGAVESRLDSMDGRLGAVESRLDSMDSRLGAVESRLDSVESRLNQLQEDVEILKEDTKVTRGAVNQLLDWADDAGIQAVPLFNKKAK